MLVCFQPGCGLEFREPTAVSGCGCLRRTLITSIDTGANSGNLPMIATVSLETTSPVDRIMAKDGKFRWSKWIFILVMLGAALGGVMYFKNDHTEAPQYQSTAVSRGDLTQVVTASGQVNPVLNVQVGSQISGNIAKLFADYNSLVKSNQVVAQLDPAIFQAAVHQAEGDLANAKASLELQRVEEKRSKTLFDSKLISNSDYDTAVASLHQAEAQVDRKQAALERAQLDLDHCTIYAPVEGIVISRNVD